MVSDPQRTGPLLRAVAKAVRPGDIVLDIGTGLGPLAIAAAKAGAGRVWAIDCDARALDIAHSRARKSGVSDRISFVEGLSCDLDLPERADLVICETVGSFAFDENILAILSDAKRRFLKRNGRIIPQGLELWGAPMDRMPRIDGPADIARVKKGDLMGPPCRLASVDFRKRIETSIHVKRAFRCSRAGAVRAFAMWPRVVWWRGEMTNASPSSPPTHWKHGILPVEPRGVKSGVAIRLELVIRPHPEDPMRMTERLWKRTL